MSGAVATPIEDKQDSGVASGEHAAYRLGGAGGLLGALDLDGPLLCDLPPAVADLVHGEHLDSGADPRAARDRSREAHLVPAVVDAQPEAAGLQHLLAEAVDQAECEVAMSHGAAERAL